MIKTSDGTSYKRVGGLLGDRTPSAGFQRLRAVYTASGGETSLDLSILSPQISYMPGQAQISVKRSSGGTMISGLDFFETSGSTISFPGSDPLVAGEVVEVVREYSVSGVMAVTPRPDVYTTTGTAGQTLVSASFSWQYNINPTSAQGGVLVHLNGILQSRGIDYTEVNLGSGNTNQIQFLDPLAGGENIILLPAYQAVDTSAATSTFLGLQNSGIQSSLRSSTQAFVDETSLISVPSTTIVNRAKIPNLAANLRASMGLERIMTQNIYQLQSEFGPNGEPVFGAMNDRRNLIRFVGHWISGNDNNGVRAIAQAQGAYVEVTFYGTGLNWLSEGMELISGRVIQVSVDGGTATSLSTEANASNMLHTRGYTHNVVRNIASGLSLGVHTVKLSVTTGTYLNVHGFEVLNASSNISVTPGIAYIGGSKVELTLPKSFSYNTGVTGTRGGRQVVYLASDGTVSNTFQPVDATQKNLTAADHSNEEIVRTYHWREFGAGRTDDFSRVFSTTSFGAAAFTLDDGTTTLTATGAAVLTNIREGVRALAGTSNFISLTFIGTGLDIILDDDGNTNRSYTISVDGTSTGTVVNGSASKVRQVKIVSGLPYGTHVVKIANNSATFDASAILQFIVYQPKKPTLPASAIELADYNVMATFVANTVSDPFMISTGVLRKPALREIAYIDGTGGTGNWAATASSPSLQVSGTEVYSDRSNATARYTFFGTGFDLRSYRDANRSSNISVQIDGLFATTANFPSATISTYGFSISAGLLSQNGAALAGAGLVVSGLPLGLHTVTLGNNTAGSIFSLDTIDVITPIHSHKANIYTNTQNALTVGSCSISDNRNTSMLKEFLTTQKAWAQAVGVTATPTTTSTTFVPVPDMSCTITLSQDALVRCAFSTNCYSNTAGQGVYFAIFVDGVQVGTLHGVDASSVSYQMMVSFERQLQLSAGTHKVDAYWKVTGGTGSCHNAYRTLLVEQK